jgi:hypothetical protein
LVEVGMKPIVAPYGSELSHSGMNRRLEMGAALNP